MNFFLTVLQKMRKEHRKTRIYFSCFTIFLHCRVHNAIEQTLKVSEQKQGGDSV